MVDEVYAPEKKELDWKRLYERTCETATRYKIPKPRREEYRFAKYLIDEIFTNKQDQIIYFEGDRGSGKSWAAGRLAELFQLILVTLGVHQNMKDGNYMTFDSREFVEWARKYEDLRFCDIRFYDEPGTGELGKHRQLTLEGQLASGIVQAWRHRQQILILATPSDSETNLSLRIYKTWALKPPTWRWRRYVRKGYTQGRARNLNKKLGVSVWDVKACEYDPDIGSLEKWKRAKHARTGRRYKKQMVYFKKPSQKWIDAYEKRKPQDIGEVFERRYHDLPWVKAEEKRDSDSYSRKKEEVESEW